MLQCHDCRLVLLYMQCYPLTVALVIVHNVVIIIDGMSVEFDLKQVTV